MPTPRHLHHRRRSRRQDDHPADSVLDAQLRGFVPLCRLWALRALLELGAFEELRHGDHFSAPQLLRFVDPTAVAAADDNEPFANSTPNARWPGCASACATPWPRHRVSRPTRRWPATCSGCAPNWA